MKGREDLSRARVALIDRITELSNAGGWPEDMALVASVLSALREGTDDGDARAVALAKRLPRLVGMRAGFEFEVAEWIGMLRRAETMDAALSITTETDEETGAVTAVRVAEVPGGTAMDGDHRIMAFTGQMRGPVVRLTGEPKTGRSPWTAQDGEPS